jgi:hypothetical protein
MANNTNDHIVSRRDPRPHQNKYCNKNENLNDYRVVVILMAKMMVVAVAAMKLLKLRRRGTPWFPWSSQSNLNCFVFNFTLNYTTELLIVVFSNG